MFRFNNIYVCPNAVHIYHICFIYFVGLFECQHNCMCSAVDVVFSLLSCGGSEWAVLWRSSGEGLFL